MEAIILGCGEAFDENLPNTSLLVKSSALLLLDCGFSAAPQVWKAVPDPGAIDLIYLSHAHADHYFGMPGLLGRMWEEGRTKPLHIVSQSSVIDQLRRALELGYRSMPERYRFPIDYRPANAGDTLEFADVAMDFAETVHSASNLAIRISSGGKSICYSGDGSLTDSSRQLFTGTDLLIHEAYTIEERKFHADIPSLISFAGQVRSIGLVHIQRRLRAAPSRILELIGPTAGRVTIPEPMTHFSV